MLLLLNNIVKGEICNYGFYAKKEGLGLDLNEYDCTKLGTKTFVYNGSRLMFCHEHYLLVSATVAANKQHSTAE